MTAKSNLKSKYVVEREVVINNMEEGHAILTMLGCKVKYKIEKLEKFLNLKVVKK